MPTEKDKNQGRVNTAGPGIRLPEYGPGPATYWLHELWQMPSYFLGTGIEVLYVTFSCKMTIGLW